MIFGLYQHLPVETGLKERFMLRRVPEGDGRSKGTGGYSVRESAVRRVFLRDAEILKQYRERIPGEKP
jgi:hypothetical protein